MSLELTVLGSAGSHPAAGRLCSGLLVRHTADGVTTALLVDAGNGSTANLQRLLPLGALDAVVISHRHLDHCVDLASATYALRFDAAFAAAGRRLPVLAAAEVHDTLRMLAGEEVDHVLAVETVRGGDVRDVGPLRLTFADVLHPVPTVAVAIDDGAHRIIVSGDTAATEALVDLARGADLLVCEATWAGEAADHPPGVHLTASGAAAIAAAAGVGRLVLTHLAGATDRARALAEARAGFPGPVDLAEDLATYALGPGDAGSGPASEPAGHR